MERLNLHKVTLQMNLLIVDHVGWGLYQFPRVAASTYLVLENHRIIQNQAVGRATLPPQTLGEIFPLCLPASGGHQHPCACGCLTLISASVFKWPLLFSVCLSNVSFIRVFALDLGPLCSIIQGDLMSRNLMTSSETIYLTQVLRITERGATISPLQRLIQ